MPCIEPTPTLRRAAAAASAAVAAALAACTSPAPPRVPAPTPSTTPAPSAVLPAPATRAARNWDEFRVEAARRLVLANPSATYLSVPPEPLLAIPVLEVELKADGSVQQVRVMRQPSQATDTTQLAIDAVYRAAPYGPVAHLPKPWRFVEVFLFADDRRFKPRSLD